jgi:two-component system, chemotaxis family, sensor kinase Cph1
MSAKKPKGSYMKEESYRSILENIQDAYIRADKDGNIIMASPSAARMYRFDSPQEMIGIPALSLYKNPEDRESMLEELKKHGKVDDYESEALRKDGTSFTVSLNSQFHYDEQGQIQGTEAFVRDITERKKTEEALQDSLNREVFLADLLEFSAQPFGVGYPDGRLGLINRAFEDLTGYTKEELKKIDWLQVLTPIEFRDMEQEKLEELQDSGQPVRYEKEYIRKDGTRVPIELLVHLVRNEDGTPKYYYSFITNITRRKKAEDELKRINIELSEITSDLQTILDIAPIVIWIAHDPECRYITGNAYADEIIMRVPRGGNISRSAPIEEQAVSYKVFQNGIELNPNELPAQIAAATGEPVEENELDLVFSDGRIVKILLGAVPLFNSQGKVRGAIAAGMDITHHKLIQESLSESEERLRLAQTQGNVGVWDWNTITDKLSFTPELEQLYGLSQGTIKTYHDWRQLTHPDDIGKIEADREDKIAKHKPFDLEFRIFHKSGDIRWLSARGGAIYNKKGDVVRVLGINTDITERKEREMLSDALNSVNAYINSTLDYSEIMQLIVEKGAKALGAESSVINIREGNNWVVKFVYNFPNSIINQIKSDRESPTSVYVAKKLEAVAFDDAQKDYRVNKNGMEMHGVASLLVAPIILKNEVIGIIAFYHHKKQVIFNETQIDFANKLAFSLSQAVENAQLFEEVKRSEKKYHSLYSSMSEGVAIHEIIYNSHQEAVDYIITDVNQAYEDITGLKRSEIIGKKASDLYGTGEPPYIEIYAPVADGGEPTQFETNFEPMGKQFSISVVSPDKGKFATVFEDITERKKAEEELREAHDNLELMVEEELKKSSIYNRKLIETSLDPLVTIGPDGKITDVNMATEKVTGYPREELVGTDFADYFTKPEEAKAGYQQVFRDGTVRDYPLEIKHKNGVLTPVLYNASVYKDESGGVVGVFAAARDITERKKAEEELQQYWESLEEQVKLRTEELAKSNADLKQFAYVASHDLREPLRMISSFLQLLERRYKDQLDQDANEFIGYAVNGAKRLDKMIMDLLEYSRVANKEIQFTDVDLEEVTDQIKSNLNVLINENRAKITYDSFPIIRGDKNQMIILLQNLISNAIKYRQEETPRIHVSAEKEGDRFIFSVKDNGIGIDPRHLERIFTIFQRLHNHEEYEGSGIGLSIAQRVVHQHGGEIWAESEPGKGSTFYFTIPGNK